MKDRMKKGGTKVEEDGGSRGERVIGGERRGGIKEGSRGGGGRRSVPVVILLEGEIKLVLWCCHSNETFLPSPLFFGNWHNMP